MDQAPQSERWVRLAKTHDLATLGNQVTAQRLHFPTPMLREMEKWSEKLGQSVSWCARMAWSIAACDLEEEGQFDELSGHRLLKGKKHPERIELPLTCWFDLTLECERLDRSKSWMLQRAWLIARPRFMQAMR